MCGLCAVSWAIDMACVYNDNWLRLHLAVVAFWIGPCFGCRV